MKNAWFWWTWGIVSWALYLTVVAIPMWLLGIPVCLYLSLTRQYEFRKSKLWSYDILAWTPKWVYPWGNEEDGVDGARGGQKWSDDTFQMAWWFKKTAGWPEWLVLFWWTAIRNPTNNLRFIKPFGFTLKPQDYYDLTEVEDIGNAESPHETWPGKWKWFFARYRGYTALYVAYSNVRFRIGWNIYPSDLAYRNYFDDAYRTKGIGFKLQLQRD